MRIQLHAISSYRHQGLRNVLASRLSWPCKSGQTIEDVGNCPDSDISSRWSNFKHCVTHTRVSLSVPLLVLPLAAASKVVRILMSWLFDSQNVVSVTSRLWHARPYANTNRTETAPALKLWHIGANYGQNISQMAQVLKYGRVHK